MKININNIQKNKFGFCIFGKPGKTIQSWINHWELKTDKSGKFTNIYIDKNINDLFLDTFEPYEYVDGFSPNLNKHLHVGHLSNLCIASAFQNMGIGNQFISILGDTLDGKVEQNDAFEKYLDFCNKFNYNVDDIFYASEMKYDGELIDGQGDFEGTKVFKIEDEYIVGIKSDGSTSYFYQDVVLAKYLNKPTLYLTGFEQDNHFNLLNKLIPTVNHIGLGLVLIDGKKMSSSEGNVIMASEFFELLKEFENDKLIANIIAGAILKSKPSQVKNISLKQLSNPKNSPGLYLSYTMARLKSAGLVKNNIDEFNSIDLQYAYLKAKSNLSPNILLTELVELCKKINSLYINHTIKDNIENQKMFQVLLNDLEYGTKLLGMHSIDKV